MLEPKVKNKRAKEIMPSWLWPKLDERKWLAIHPAKRKMPEAEQKIVGQKLRRLKAQKAAVPECSPAVTLNVQI
jgi:hypothetical protein